MTNNETKMDGISRQYHAIAGLRSGFKTTLISEMKDKGFSLGAAPQEDFLYFIKVWSGPFGFGLMVSIFLLEEKDIVTVAVKGSSGCAIDYFIRKDIDTDIEVESADGGIRKMNVIDFIFSITERVYNEMK